MLRLFKYLFKLHFDRSGWRVEGNIPLGVKKAILIGGAHTSNWDLVYSLGTLFKLDREFRFIIKQEALVFPLKNFLLALGALPIDRSPNADHNYVDQLAKVIQESEECFLCIAPEGTRQPTKKWKTGFYHIAKKANVPIIVCYFDYPNKVAKIGPMLSQDLNEKEAMAEMKTLLQQARPKNPHNFKM